MNTAPVQDRDRLAMEKLPVARAFGSPKQIDQRQGDGRLFVQHDKVRVRAEPRIAHADG
jgi:hypothetical protein